MSAGKQHTHIDTVISLSLKEKDKSFFLSLNAVLICLFLDLSYCAGGPHAFHNTKGTPSAFLI